MFTSTGVTSLRTDPGQRFSAVVFCRAVVVVFVESWLEIANARRMTEDRGRDSQTLCPVVDRILSHTPYSTMKRERA